jgi:hypothetical protein
LVRPTAERAAPAVGVALLLSFVLTGPALAHGGGPRLLVSPDPVNPGGVVELRGEDLGADASLVLYLVGSSGEVSLGPSTADGEGHFVLFVQIPAEMPVGMYAVHAREGEATGAKAPLAIAGAPIVDGGEPIRDESEPLLVALPAGWQQSLSGPSTTARPVTGPAPLGAPPADAAGTEALLVPMVLLVGALVVGAVAVAGLRRRGRLNRPA